MGVVMTTTQAQAQAQGPNWIGNGGVFIRTAMLMTHYKSSPEWKPETLSVAETLWRKLWAQAEPCDDAPPEEVVEALRADMDTPKAFVHMITYAQNKSSRKLYASMRFLGLVPQPGEIIT